MFMLGKVGKVSTKEEQRGGAVDQPLMICTLLSYVTGKEGEFSLYKMKIAF